VQADQVQCRSGVAEDRPGGRKPWPLISAWSRAGSLPACAEPLLKRPREAGGVDALAPLMAGLFPERKHGSPLLTTVIGNHDKAVETFPTIRLKWRTSARFVFMRTVGDILKIKFFAFIPSPLGLWPPQVGSLGAFWLTCRSGL